MTDPKEGFAVPSGTAAGSRGARVPASPALVSPALVACVAAHCAAARRLSAAVALARRGADSSHCFLKLYRYVHVL